MQKKILFISHDASRTGAPLILLNFLKWFKNNTNIPFQILLKNGGELESEFAAIAPVSIFSDNKQASLASKIINGVSNKLGIERRTFQNQKLKKKLIQDNIILIYANTVMNGEILEFLKDIQCPIISHIHELEFIIKTYCGYDNFELVKKNTTQYIAVSKAVKNNLIKNHQIEEDKIELIYEFPISFSDTTDNYHELRSKICQELNISEESKIISASGFVQWRKGSDLWIQIAHHIRQQYSDNPVYFLWIGDGCKGIYFEQIVHEIKLLGLEDYIRFLGQKSNPLDYFTASDIFVLPSREDPFPLVCLEAASRGKPIVCFDDAGGMKEFVEDDCGFVVPYLDIQTMADKVIQLLENSHLREQMGSRARQKVMEKYNHKLIGLQISQIIEQVISASS